MSKKKNGSSDKRLNLKLSLMAGLDEEIVDRNTEKRYMLSKAQGKRMNVRAWIPVLSAVACVCLIFGAIFLLFPREDERQVPIYQGMTVSNTYSANGGETLGIGMPIRTLSARDPFFGLGVLNMTENYEELLSELLEQIVPPAESGSETETEAPSTLTDFSAKRYFAKPNEDIYITIHFSNPDKFEILSFTLNGEKFSNYMFEAGSDMEHLVLKQNVGSVCGLVEFTIDAIKYVDGTEIKDVQMDGDRTVEVGVYENELPKVTATELTAGFFDVRFDVTLNESTPTLLRLYDTEVAVALYQNNTRIEKKVLPREEWGKATSIVFEHLVSDADYIVALEAVYDAQDGKGEQLYYFWQESFRTEAAVGLEILETGREHVKLGLTWNEAYPQKEFLSLRVLDENGALMQEVPLTEIVPAEGSEGLKFEAMITGLVSGNRKHTIVVGYSNEQMIGEVKTYVYTGVYLMPLFQITNPTSDFVSIDFEVQEKGFMPKEYAITRIELLDWKGDLLATGDETTRRFEGLNSNTRYMVKLYYTCDLHDGNGPREVSISKVIVTARKQTPTVELATTDTDSSSVTFSLSETDPDEVGAVTKIELLDKDGTVIETAPNVDVRRFEGLESQTVYTVRVTYEYDLNDGSGVKTETKTCTMAHGYVPVTQLSTDEDTVLLTGETLPLKLTLQRPTGVALEMISAKVNGVEYALSRLTANTYGITYAPGIQSGRETLKITGLSYTVNGQSVTDYAEHAPTLAITVRGDVTVENVVLSQNGAYYEDDATPTATVTLKGAEGYDQVLALVDEDGYEHPLTWVEGDTYRFDLPLRGRLYEAGPFDLVLKTVKVTADGDPAEVNVRSEKICYVVMKSYLRTVTDIRTPEELQNMESGRAYRLANHIDLTGFDWVPYAFIDGALYGNGYEIRNLDMYAVIPYQSGEHRISMGMFTEISGYFKDVILKNASVEIESLVRLGGQNDSGDAGYGILAGKIGMLGILLDGCAVEGQLYIHTPGGISRSTVSGFIGSCEELGILKNCRFKGEISVEGELGVIHVGYYGIAIYPLHGTVVLDCSYEFKASVNEHQSTGDFLKIYKDVSGLKLIMSTKEGEETVIIGR